MLTAAPPRARPPRTHAHTNGRAQEAIEYGLIDAIISKPQLLQERAMA